MFTGIVEEIAVVRNITSRGTGMTICIKAPRIAGKISVGDSVAVNGVCLTARVCDGTTFTADIMAETLARTTFYRLKSGHKLHLERACTPETRLGGHILSGHIDTLGTIERIAHTDTGIHILVSHNPAYSRYIADRASIALDGVSLTVMHEDSGHFQVSLIPHTANTTLLATRHRGAAVHLEFDQLAKYAQKTQFISHASKDQAATKTLTIHGLIEQGY